MASQFDTHSLEVLEYPKVLSILEGLCLTAFGMIEVNSLVPLTDPDIIKTRLAEISQMKDIIRFGEAFPLYRLDDSTEIISKSKTEGIFLEPPDFLKLLELIEVSGALNNYASKERDKFPNIARYLAKIDSFPEIKKSIAKTIDRDGSILDSASSTLKDIRRNITSQKSRIMNRLGKTLSERTKHKGWQDDTITLRDGRYVIPVLSGQFRADSGIIHDRSHSGATLFVEPNDVIELNNNLGLLLQEERLEIDRILRKLTAMIAESADRLLTNCKVIGQLDFLHAAANFAIKTDSREPLIKNEPGFRFITCRHPLLLYYTEDKRAIIHNDISLDNGRLGIIITGPNTGGKTVALKTVGLLILMAQSGLHIPADEKSEFAIYQNIFADIGDEQSIELSLSTFSSHIRQIIYAVKNAGKDCLVLLDEIGAESILIYLAEKKVQSIVTTHYSQLKTLPTMHPEFENASFEFDRKSLKPTYRLQTGVPGASYAVEIAGRLGMPGDITSQAGQLLGHEERSLSKLTASLESELTTLRNDKIALEERLNNARQLEEYYKSQIAKLESDVDSSKRQMLVELEQTLNETRVEIEKTVKEIRESKASKETVKKAHKLLKNKTEKLKKIKKKSEPKILAEKPATGDRVWVDAFQQEGDLEELIGDDKARVRIGNIMSVIGLSDLKKVSGKKPEKVAGISADLTYELKTPGPEVHLRGMTVDEAMETLDRYLDSAVASNMSQIYVIHGKGTGTLRKVISEYLRNHSAVDSFRLGNWNEGGAGVTIVQLK
jgi:DNA mismatch repair protein MutS2